jgi:acetyl esterase/lipase
VSESKSKPSLPSRAMPLVLRLRGGTGRYASTESAREYIEQRALRPATYAPPKLRPDVDLHVTRRAGWPIYTVTPTSGGSERAVVYLHGGAWVNEIDKPHWQLVAQLAAAACVRVIVPIYPLIPFGRAAQVVPEVAELVAETARASADVCLAGDSAGGQIALSAAVLLRDRYHLVLPQTVLISPVLDIALTNPLIHAAEAVDPWLRRDPLLEFAAPWRGELAVDDPLVSPLAAALTGLGPITLFSGTRDLLNPDARLLVQRATAAGVDVGYHEERGLLHVYPLMPTPEGRAARAVMVELLRADGG